MKKKKKWTRPRMNKIELKDKKLIAILACDKPDEVACTSDYAATWS